jgi:hypothetical protein
MLRLRKPDRGAIEEFIAAQRDGKFSYAEVGASWGASCRRSWLVSFAGEGLGYDLVLVFVDDVADAVGIEHADGDAVNLQGGEVVARLVEMSMGGIFEPADRGTKSRSLTTVRQGRANGFGMTTLRKKQQRRRGPSSSAAADSLGMTRG